MFLGILEMFVILRKNIIDRFEAGAIKDDPIIFNNYYDHGNFIIVSK